MSKDPRAKLMSVQEILPNVIGGSAGPCPDLICAHIRNAKWGDRESVEQLRNLLHLAANSMPDADVLEVATFIHRAGQTMLWANPPARSIGAPE